MTVIEKIRIGAPGIAGRVFLYTSAIVALVLGAALLVSTYSSRRAARLAERRGLEQAADVTAQLLAGRGRALAGGARVFVQGPYFRSLVRERRRDDILDQTIEAVTQLDASWAFITDERGTLIAKSDEPGVGGVPYALQGAGLTTAGGEVVGGFVVGRPENGTPAEMAGMRRSLLAAGLLGVLLALGAAWSSARRVTQPARALAAAAAHALEG